MVAGSAEKLESQLSAFVLFPAARNISAEQWRAIYRNGESKIFVAFLDITVYSTTRWLLFLHYLGWRKFSFESLLQSWAAPEHILSRFDSHPVFKTLERISKFYLLTCLTVIFLDRLIVLRASFSLIPYLKFCVSDEFFHVYFPRYFSVECTNTCQEKTELNTFKSAVNTPTAYYLN